MCDIFRMYDQGHVVVGVEVARQAMEEFFKENNIDYTTEHVEAIDGTLYKVSACPYLSEFDTVKQTLA